MAWLYFTKFSIHGLTQLLLSLLIMVYLLSVPDKSRPTRLMVIFFGGFVLTSLAHFLLVSIFVPWRFVFGLSQAFGGAISLVALVQFAYWFPENRHLKESRIALWLSIVLSLAHGLLADRNNLVDSHAFFYSGLVMTLEVAWPIVVMVRKVLMFAQDAQSRSVWERLRHPGNREARALRAFALLSLLWVFLSGALVLESLGYLSVEILMITLVGAILFFLFGFVLIYMNTSASSLKVKSVGIAIVVLLLVMGDMGAFILRDFEARYNEFCLAEVQQCRKALVEEDDDIIPEDVILINGYDIADNTQIKTLFQRGALADSTFHKDYVVHEFTPRILAELKKNPGGDPNAIRDAIAQRFNRADMVRLNLEYNFGGLISDLNYAVYYFTMDDRLFEVHYPVVRYMTMIHGFAAKLIGFILGTTVFIVIFFPLFLRSALDRPLNDLLDGVRQVNTGRLDVAVTVHVEDEIGYVAQAFNRMVDSVRQADQKLKGYAQELEQRVDERTQDLREKNETLAQTLHELQAAQRHLMMQEKMASLGELVAGVAHEINNPIGAVKSSADVSVRCVSKIELEIGNQASLEALRKSPAFVQSLTLLRNNVKVMQSAGDRVATLVASLKNFSRVDEAEFQRVDLHEGIESSLTLIRISEQVQVIKDYGEVVPVFCAPGQINQVFYNVLKNAAGAISGGGEIHIGTHQEEHVAVVVVRDNGRGIPQAVLDHVFEFRFTHTDTRIKMGSGLASAYDIVQQHGGEIAVESEESVGTVVTIRLPIRMGG